MKLELKHLAPYLPYGLNVQTKLREATGKGKPMNRTIGELHGLYINYGHATSVVFKGEQPEHDILDLEIDTIKPILRPLSDYTDITSKAMSDLDCDLSDQMDIQEFALKKMSLASLLYSSFEVLARNHVDIFGLIPEGLAIDLNTLKP